MKQFSGVDDANKNITATVLDTDANKTITCYPFFTREYGIYLYLVIMYERKKWWSTKI